MVYAGTNARSFQQAERDLAAQAELSISAQRIMRATKRIGRERAAGREAAVETWRKLPLPAQQGSPHEHVPQVACVQVDGGRRRDSRAWEQRPRQGGRFLARDEGGLSVADA